MTPPDSQPPIERDLAADDVKANSLALWSDEPASTDLLSFNAVAETIADALFDEKLNPIALGVSGSWGSGKTTVLNLIETQVTLRSADEAKAVLVVRADPWRYDPSVGPKESLISEVLAALSKEFSDADVVGKTAGEAFKKLVKRVNWAKALKLAARTSLTLQLPKLDDVLDLVSDTPETLESEKGMMAFREEFRAFLQEPALAHVSQVVVLVDDLDRCLPDTVVETLEAIRLFLSVEGMSFVIAADEERVADAIQQKLKTPNAPNEEEGVASLYLHKIVQTTIPLPALSYFDTRAYLFLLLAQSKVPQETYDQLVLDCSALRVGAGSLDDLTLPKGYDLSLEVATASRLTPILYEKFKGNPRRIKRFMNDLNVRSSVASKRGIKLEADAIAKLMVLEKLLDGDFTTVLNWLAKGQLRPQLEALEKVRTSGAGSTSNDDDAKPVKAGKQPVEPQEDTLGGFSATMVRWAKLPPALDASAVSGYLTLAAAFKGRQLVDESLPEQLRDIAAALTSSSQIDRMSVKDEELKQMPLGDVTELLLHLGRRMQDDPSVQLNTVNAILTLAKLHPQAIATAKIALGKLPAQEVATPTALLFDAGTAQQFADVLTSWKNGAQDERLVKAIDSVAEGSS